jgi:hypothetical protein
MTDGGQNQIAWLQPIIARQFLRANDCFKNISDFLDARGLLLAI